MSTIATPLEAAPARELERIDANVLFVAKFGTNTGYAWDTIERVFAGVARRLVTKGIGVHVSYASLAGGAPDAMRGLPIAIHQVDFFNLARRPLHLIRFLRLLRHERIRVLYLTDRPTWTPLYVLFRLAGVRRILVHDRTSGDRTQRSALVQLGKRAIHHVPGIAGDVFIGVSEYVTRRLREINGTPADRTVCVHNGIDLAPFDHVDRACIRRELELDGDAPIVFFAGRMQRYKGVQALLDAVARLQSEGRRFVTVCCGDGSDFDSFRTHARDRGLRDVVFTGKRSDVARLLPGATIAVVPSLWAEAFGLSVVEAMAAGVPLVATRTGGIPELVREGETGVLVSPGNPDELAAAIGTLLDDVALRQRMAVAACAHARRCFGIERTVRELYEVLENVVLGR